MTIINKKQSPIGNPSVTHNYTLHIIEPFLYVKAVTLIFISGRGSAISSAKQRKSGSIYNLVKN